VDQNPNNCHDKPIFVAIVGIGKPHNRDSRIAQGKSHVAEDSAAIGQEGVELIIHVNAHHGGDTATNLTRTPDEAHQVEKVLSTAPANVSQCVSFNEEKVRDVDKVEHEKP